MDVRTMNLAKRRISEAYNEVRGTAAAVSPELITLILGLGIEILSGCFKRGLNSQQIVESAKDPNLLQRLAIRRKIAKSPSVQKSDRKQVMQTILIAAAKSTPAQIEAVHRL